MGKAMKIATECICCGSKELDSWKAEVMPFVANRVCLDFNDCHTLRCRNCGVTFLDLRYDDEQIKALYSGYRDEQYITERERFEDGYRLRQLGFSGGLPYVADIEEFLSEYPHKKILDWGGGSGINTPFRETSADVFDISGVQPEYGKLIDKPGKYDLVVFANVIEHTPDPARELERIKKHMRGVLYIEVSLDDATDKKRWHEHINIFTGQSLLKLAKRCGLEVLDTRLIDSPPYHPYFMVCK
jgi:SAM-dependent methyltransferase